MNIFRRLFGFWACFHQDHDFVFDSPGLGGDWIRCTRCGTLDEYIPGVHEPEGYTP